jgi:hypothetical protein
MLIIRRKKHHKKIPYVEPIAKLWMEANNPECIKTIPKTQHKKISILRKKVQWFNLGKMIEWIQAVANIQAIRETFSIGSQNHQPPQLNSW